MKKLSILLTGLISSTGLLVSASSGAAMDPYVEKALQQVCYTSTADRLYTFKQTIQSYRLKMKDVANKVVCNGEDIGTFAAENGAVKTASYIRNYQQGEVEIHQLVYVTLPAPPKS